MASSSNTITVPLKKHDVFISFRGEDTRANFTSFLHAALCRRYVRTYIDDRIDKGDEIWAELVKAIKGSTLFLVVFSENYASSTWCLNELIEIMNCKKNGQVVFPVFYHIDPSHVRKQTGSYCTALAEHRKHGKEKMQKWKDALCEAANLSGFNSNKYRTESDLIEEITKVVLEKLDHEYKEELTCDFIPNENYSDIIESSMKIDSREVQIIGLWGMGGIGKTTLAAAIFHKVSSQYEGSCFFENVTEESKRHGFNYICNKLLSKLLGEVLDIDTPKVIPSMVRRRLKCMKAFIVLDDVHTSELLQNLIVVGRDWLGAGSAVIVTTRDKHVLISGGVDEIHQVKEMNSQDSLRLFSLNAFNKVLPKEGYVELSKRAIDHAKGNPLALKVLGSFLRYKSETEWAGALAKLKEIPNADIQRVLRWSYNELDDDEKKIFLHITGFFEGYKRDKVLIYTPQMVPKYDQVSDIVAIKQENVRLLVKVVHKWGVPNPRINDKIVAIELVLMDSKGDRIGVFIREQLMYIFEKKVFEDEIYVLSKMRVIINSGDYRSTKHPYKMSFEKNTQVAKQPKTSLPKTVFKFTPPADIFSGDFDYSFLVDIIGILTDVGDVREYVKNQQKSKLSIIELDNEGYKFKIKLFGEFVDEFSSFVASGHATNAVVAVLFAKVKIWNNIKSISTTYGSKLMLSPEISEAVDLKQRTDCLIETPNKCLSQLKNVAKISLEDDFLKLTKRASLKTIKAAYQKNDAKAPTEDMPSFVVLATIISFEDEIKWYYHACNKCTKKVTPDSEEYYCARCKMHVMDVSPKYLFRLRVEDENASATFVMFDRDAQILLNQTCVKLLQSIDKRGDSHDLPNELIELQDKFYLFKVGCDRGSGSRFESSCVVKRVSGRTDLIQDFKVLTDSEDIQMTLLDVNTSADAAVSTCKDVQDVAQDLIEKFDESIQQAIEEKSDNDVVDLCLDSPGVLMEKRSCPIDVPCAPFKLIKKDIKKEKD